MEEEGGGMKTIPLLSPVFSLVFSQVFFLAVMAILPMSAAPLRLSHDLIGFTIYEITNNTTTGYVFSSTGPEVTAKLNTIFNNIPDFITPDFERFDLYYSRGNGVYDLDGGFLTVDCTYSGIGSGCNFAEVQLNRSVGESPFAPSILRVSTTTGYIEGSESLAKDGNLSTASSLGSGPANIMSMTFSFDPPSRTTLPEPGTYATLGAGLLALLWIGRR
jgi:hypothetical protein